MTKLIGLTAALSLVAFGICDLPAHANGTVKSRECSPYKSDRYYVEPCEELSPEPPCPPQLYKSGVYAGGQAGWNWLHGKFTNGYKAVGQQTTYSRGTRDRNGVIGELLFGARYFFPTQVSLGFEVAADWDTNELKKRASHIQQQLDVKFFRQYAITPAITVSRVFQTYWNFIGKLGLGISRFKTKMDDVTTGEHFRQQKTQIGVVPSLALEYAITTYLSVIGTVTYEYYDSVSVTFRNADNMKGRVTNRVKNVQYVATKIGIIAKF